MPVLDRVPGLRRWWGVLAAVCLVFAASDGAAATSEPLSDPPASWPRPDSPDAEAWILVDGETGQVLAGAAMDQRRPVASAVKVLAAVTVSARASLDAEVVVGDEVVGVGGASVGLAPGDRWTVEELLDAVIARSGNDAVAALAVHVAGSQEAFVALMRADARGLGLDGVVLTSPSGLDDGNLLSARDLATIARAALSDAALRPLFARGLVELPGLGTVTSRNLLLESYPGATGLKTGFTSAAGNTLVASARRDGRELVAVVLGAGDDPVRFELAAQLLDVGFAEFVQAEVGGRLAIAVAGSVITVDVPPVTVAAPVGEPVRLAFTVPTVIEALPSTVALDAGGHTLALLPATIAGPDRGPADDGAAVARSVVDHAYAALRAAARGGALR